LAKKQIHATRPSVLSHRQAPPPARRRADRLAALAEELGPGLLPLTLDVRDRAAVYAGADALTPDDIADTVHWVASRPARVNINVLEVMPVCQAFGPLAIKRQG